MERMNWHKLLLFVLQSIDEKNQKDWYKNMYKSLHKTEKPKGGCASNAMCTALLLCS